MADWNGVAMAQKHQESHHMWTDASGNWGCGAVCPATNQWLQLKWPERYPQEWVRVKDESITLKELLPVVLACAVWGENWKKSAITVHCDNMGVVALVNSGTAASLK